MTHIAHKMYTHTHMTHTMYTRMHHTHTTYTHAHDKHDVHMHASHTWRTHAHIHILTHTHMHTHAINHTGAPNEAVGENPAEERRGGEEEEGAGGEEAAWPSGQNQVSSSSCSCETCPTCWRVVIKQLYKGLLRPLLMLPFLPQVWLLAWFSWPRSQAYPYFCVRNGKDLGALITWVTPSGHVGIINRLKHWLSGVSQVLTYSVLVKCLNLARWMMNWSRTCWTKYTPSPPTHPPTSTVNPPEVTRDECSLFLALFRVCVSLSKQTMAMI